MSAGPVTSRREQLQAVLLAALCAVLFLRDAVLPGRALVPFPPEAIEPLRSELAAAGRDPGQDLRGNPAYADKYNQSLNWDRTTQRALREGRLPLWTRGIAGGAAFVPQMGQIYQPWNALLLVVPSTEVYGLWFLLHQIVFGWLAYRFLRRLRVRHDSALFGVVVAVVGLWTQGRVHHNVILTAALPTFAMLSCVLALFAGGGARSAGVLALASGLSWLGGLPQASLLASDLTLAWALLSAARAPRGRRLRPLLWTGLGLAVGGLVAAAQMGPVLLAAAQSARESGTAADLVARSFDAAQLRTLLWPDLFGWPNETFYGAIEATRLPWQTLLHLDLDRVRQFAIEKYPEAAFAVGVAPLALALQALLSRRVEVAFFAGAAALGLAFAFGVWPLPTLSAAVPGARAGDPRRWVFLWAVSAPVLAALGWDEVRARPRPWLAATTCAVVALVSAVGWWQHAGTAEQTVERYAPAMAARYAALSPGLDPALAERNVRAALAPGEAEANRDHLRATFARATLAAGAGVVLLLLHRRRGAGILLALSAALELVHSGLGPVVAVDSARVERAPSVLAPALSASADAAGPPARCQRLVAATDTRRGPLLSPNLGAFFGLQDLTSYHPLPPRRLEELFTAIEPNRPGKASIALGGAGVDAFRDPQSLLHPLCDVLGLRFVLSDQVIALPGVVDRTPPGTAAPYHLYERTTALPRATFVTRAVVEPDRTARLALLADRGRDAAREVVLEDPDAPRPTPSGDDAADVAIQSDADERVVLSVRARAAGYLRLADPWDAGWCAVVDGYESPVYVADHDLRAVWLPPGQHVVEFAYRGPTVRWPRRLSVLGLFLVAALLCWPRARAPKQ